jgi:DNA mismatch endonuclease (patch repair protein)
MADVVSPAVRSRMMSGIRGKNTKPELFLRSALHSQGFRFRIHAALPGKPDLVFPKWRAVIFVHGCFWHGHRCHLFKWPKSRKEFWKDKITGNVSRDEGRIAELLAMGWRIGIVWECALKGRGHLSRDHIVSRCSTWLRSGRKRFELAGTNDHAPRTPV